MQSSLLVTGRNCAIAPPPTLPTTNNGRVAEVMQYRLHNVHSQVRFETEYNFCMELTTMKTTWKMQIGRVREVLKKQRQKSSTNELWGY